MQFGTQAEALKIPEGISWMSIRWKKCEKKNHQSGKFVWPAGYEIERIYIYIYYNLYNLTTYFLHYHRFILMIDDAWYLLFTSW